MGPTSCCCELKSEAARKTCLYSSLSFWRTTGCRGLTPAPHCRTAARPAWPAAPGTAATAAKPAAAAASSGRKARDTATDRPSRSETGRGRRERHGVALPAAGCLPAEVLFGALLEGGSRSEGLPHAFPQNTRPYPAPQSSHLTEEVQILWLADRLVQEVGGSAGRSRICRRGVFENVRWVPQQTVRQRGCLRIGWGSAQGPTSSILSFFLPLLFFQGTSGRVLTPFFLTLHSVFWDQTCLHTLWIVITL